MLVTFGKNGTANQLVEETYNIVGETASRGGQVKSAALCPISPIFFLLQRISTEDWTDRMVKTNTKDKMVKVSF